MDRRKKGLFKNVSAILLSLLMIVSFVVAEQNNVFAATVTTKIDKATGLEYDSTGVILSYTGSSANVVIPAKIGKVTIKKIGHDAFFNNDTLKTVSLPTGLTEIGRNAFESCDLLTTINLPSTLLVIDTCAFFECKSLKGMTVPKGVTYIGDLAFSNCKSITTLNIPTTVLYLGMEAFAGTGITSIVIPSNITILRQDLFSGSLLKSVVVPSSVKTMENYVFSSCSQLTSVTIPKTVTTIGVDEFKDSPLVTVYGENDSQAQVNCANYHVKFVESSAASSSTPVISSETIVIPADTKAATVTATPSTTKLAVNNVAKSLEGYTINGEDYYKIKDLGTILEGQQLVFGPEYDSVHHFMQLTYTGGEGTTNVLTKGDGKAKQASRVYPDIYQGFVDVSGSICVYAIANEDYYRFSDVMNIINCGVIKNTKTGVLNMNPALAYEPLNSPVFAPVPNGNATYMKVQKGLYDAYLSGKSSYDPPSNITIPDNVTLYVPRGIEFDRLGPNKINIGNNANFIVKGTWEHEYPDRDIHVTSSTVKNAVFSYGFNPVNALGDLGANNNVVLVGSVNNFEWSNLPLTSATISYGNISNGVASIILNVVKDKRGPESCLYVYFHVKGGESYGYLYKNAVTGVDLTQQMVNVIARNIGKSAVVDRVDVQSANGISFSKRVSLPVNWAIKTCGIAPEGQKNVYYASPDAGNSLKFSGLTQGSYIVKSKFEKATAYGLMSKKNDYTIAPLYDYGTDFHEFAYDASGLYDNAYQITGESSNIALFTGVKEATGKDTYTFKVSPFSSNIDYVINDDAYPTEATLVTENKKTYINFALNTSELEPGSSYGSSYDIMVKYHKKGDSADTLGVLYADSAKMDSATAKGKLDLTPALTTLTNAKGSVTIDGLYVYTYFSRTGDNAHFPSEKFVSIACDFTTNATESVKLGSDTVVRVIASVDEGPEPALGTSIKAPITVNNITYQSFESIQFSPAGKNQWSANVLSSVLSYDSSVNTQFTYKTGTKYDIKLIDADAYEKTQYIIKNLDFSGISAITGGTLIIDQNSSVEVTLKKNIQLKTIKAGDFGTDTIDVVLKGGTEVTTFNLADFTITLDDWNKTLYPNADLKIVSISQTTPGNAKITISRTFDPSEEADGYSRQLLLCYKGEAVGLISFTNQY